MGDHKAFAGLSQLSHCAAAVDGENAIEVELPRLYCTVVRDKRKSEEERERLGERECVCEKERERETRRERGRGRGREKERTQSSTS